MSHKLLGEIVDHEGTISLQTAPNCWFPLSGNSGIAADFQESFNEATPSDIGRRLYRVNGVIQMESMEQAAERRRDAHNPDTNPNWTSKLGRRIYECDECHTRQTLSTNHTGTVRAANCAGTCRDISAPNTAHERVMWHPARPHRYIREAGE